MRKLTIAQYAAKGGRYVKRTKEIEAELISTKEAIRRQLHVVNARTEGDGHILFVYQDATGAYFYNVTHGAGK